METITTRLKGKPELKRAVDAAERTQTVLDTTTHMYTTEIAELKAKLANKEAAFAREVRKLKSSPNYIEPYQLDKKQKDLKELDRFLESVVMAN